MLNICSSTSVNMVLSPPPTKPAINAGRKWNKIFDTKWPISEVGTSIIVYLNRLVSVL